MAIRIGIYGSVFNRPALESVLKKCPNIRKVILCYLYESSLTLFGQYCPHLKILHINYFQFNDSDVLDFGQRYGQQLQELRVNGLHNDLFGFLSNSSNIKKLVSYKYSSIRSALNSSIFNEDNYCLPKLESIDRIDIYDQQYDNR